jgi:predicted ATPase
METSANITDFTAAQIEEVERKREADRKTAWKQVNDVCQQIVREARRGEQHRYNLEDESVYQAHANLTIYIANEICMKHQNRKFVVDDNNKDVLRFLLYYFNDCKLAEEVFPERHYKLHNNLLIQGKVGTGKTMLMQVFSEYLRRTNNPRFFHNLSVTQMVNYYTIHNNLDRFTYNEEENKGFQCSPVNVCLNDIGIQSKTFFGMDTKLLTDEFLHARNEIWVQYNKFAHVTTNLTLEQMKEEFSDGFGRLIDRFKTYNVIPLKGDSRR